MWHARGRGVRRDLVGRSEGKRPLGRPRRRWEDNIKMGPMEIGIDGANWIKLAQDRVQWRALMNTVMNIRVP
jgi:transposase